MRQFLRDGSVVGLARRHRITVGAILAAGLLGLVVYALAERQRLNRLAIEKSCILLNNKIVESRSGASSRGAAILVKEILRNAVEHHRAYVVVEYKRVSGGRPGSLTLINCHEVARHPDQIRALPIRPARARVPRG